MNRIRNLVEGTRQEEGRLFTKNIGISEEKIRSISSEFCPVLACEDGNRRIYTYILEDKN